MSDVEGKEYWVLCFPDERRHEMWKLAFEITSARNDLALKDQAVKQQITSFLGHLREDRANICDESHKYQRMARQMLKRAATEMLLWGSSLFLALILFFIVAYFTITYTDIATVFLDF